MDSEIELTFGDLKLKFVSHRIHPDNRGYRAVVPKCEDVFLDLYHDKERDLWVCSIDSYLLESPDNNYNHEVEGPPCNSPYKAVLCIFNELYRVRNALIDRLTGIEALIEVLKL